MPGNGRRKGKKGSQGPRERRGPPPDATGEEARYIRRLKEAATPLIIYLRDSTEIRGHIEYFDRDMVKITRAEGPHLFVRKDEIRYWIEA